MGLTEGPKLINEILLSIDKHDTFALLYQGRKKNLFIILN